MNNARDCPVCQQGMMARVSHGVEIDICGGCGGLWLDAGELDILLSVRFDVQGIESAFNASAKLPTLCRYCNVEHAEGQVSCSVCTRNLGIKCPVDGRGMHIVKFGEIEFDRCSSCRGVWVDGFERAVMGVQARNLQRERASASMAASSGGDWGGGSDWSSSSDWGDSADGGVSRISTGWKPPSLEVECSGCRRRVNRYSSWTNGDEFWCPQCLEHSDIGLRRATNYGSRIDAPLQVACTGCEKTFNRYSVFAHDDEFWCMQCAERSDVKGKLDGVTKVHRLMDEARRERKGPVNNRLMDEPRGYHLREDIYYSYDGKAALLEAFVNGLFRLLKL